MNVSIEEKRAEALKRMKLWGLNPDTLRKFEENEKVSLCVSPIHPNVGLTVEQEQHVWDLEHENDVLVYFMIRSHTNLGELDTMLYVSDYPEEWEADRDDIENGEQTAYVYNCDAPYCSEFGEVGIRPTAVGGLERTW